jgi:para-nitrobenzyl esterase
MKMNRRTFTRGAAAIALGTPLMGFARRPLEHPVATTLHGNVRGYRQDDINVFKGIRYGADTAQTRFAKALAPTPWAETRDATDYGASAPQSGHRDAISEDCLFLNVWTPGVADGGNRPVMVYFHGGAYASGSGSSPLYDGTNLATKGDVVVITVNHRLNAFGYLSLARLNPDFPDSGNAGMWDLVLALEWVRDNAATFGGDPSRVFVFGQSGGGAKIASLMAAPSAVGLFHSAATMSGQQVTACGPLNGQLRAQAYLDTLGIAAGDTVALRAAPMDALVDALSTRDPINSERGLYFGPVLDGRFLSRHPFWPDAPGQSSAIPMILGNTRDETRNLIGGKQPETFELDWPDVPGLLASHMRCDIDPAEVVTTYRRLYPGHSPSDVFFAATTAGRSWRGQVEEADKRAAENGPTWVYQFNLGSPEDGGKWGAPHTMDIAFAFDNLDKSGEYDGTSVPATGTYARVADELSRAFISMAHDGQPNHAGLPDWSRHTLPNRETLVFDTTTRLENDPRQGERELFAKVPFTQWGT